MSSIVTVDIKQQISEQLRNLLLEADPDWKQVQSYLLDAQVYAIYIEGQPIAEICLSPYSAHGIEIKNLSVQVDYQGQGLAKKLIQYAIETATQQGFADIWVKTGNSSLDQLALYQKMGFRIQHIEKNVFLDYPEPIYENGIRCLDQVVLCQSLKAHKK